MYKVYAGIVLVLVLITGFFFIKEQARKIDELRSELTQVQETRDAEAAHFMREQLRAQQLQELLLQTQLQNQEAERDTSDGESYFSVTRVERLNALSDTN